MRSANPPINMDSICFQTAAGVANYGDLAIVFDNIVAYPGPAKVEDLGYALDIANADGLAIDEFNAEETVYVNAKVKNETNEAKDYLVILAGYSKSGACVDVKIHELKDVQAGAVGSVDGTTLGLKLPGDVTTVKAFLWENWDSLRPVCNFDTAVLKVAE